MHVHRNVGRVGVATDVGAVQDADKHVGACKGLGISACWQRLYTAAFVVRVQVRVRVCARGPACCLACCAVRHALPLGVFGFSARTVGSHLEKAFVEDMSVVRAGGGPAATRDMVVIVAGEAGGADMAVLATLQMACYDDVRRISTYTHGVAGLCSLDCEDPGSAAGLTMQHMLLMCAEPQMPVERREHCRVQFHNVAHVLVRTYIRAGVYIRALYAFACICICMCVCAHNTGSAAVFDRLCPALATGHDWRFQRRGSGSVWHVVQDFKRQ